MEEWARTAPQLLKQVLGAVADMVIARSRSSYFAQGGGKGGPLLHVRSGRLWRSEHKSIDVSPDFVTAEVGSNVVYARIHELGGTIHHQSRGQLALGSKFVTVKRAMGKRNRTRATLRFLGEHDQVIPARPYLSTALRDVRPVIPAMILTRMMDALRKQNG
jgi:phage gpG-like protein